MSEQIRQELEWPSLLPDLQLTLGMESEEVDYLHKMRDSMICNELHVHRLHAILRGTTDSEKAMEVVNEVDLLIKLQVFLDGEIGRSLGCQLMETTIEEIIELVRRVLCFTHSRENNFEREETQKCAQILHRLHDYMISSYNSHDSSEVVQKLMECLTLIRKKAPSTLKEEFYAQMISQATSRVGDFFDFFEEYLKQSTHEYIILENLVRGFAGRLPSMLDKFQKHKSTLLRAFMTFVEFLQREPASSIWLNVLVTSEFEVIKQSLVGMASKNVLHSEMASIFDKLVGTYMRASMSNHLKYELILSLYKSIIQKSSVLFALMSTDLISEEQRFLSWFVMSELRMDRALEITQVYMSNKFALEFLLSVMIYYLYHYPERALEMSCLMRTMNLLEEAKYFMNCENVRKYLEVFHDYVGEKDTYETFQNSILDMAVTRQL